MNKYPIRVLKKKIRSTNNAPLMVDNLTGQIKTPRQGGGAKFWKPLALITTVAALLLISTQVAKPVLEASANKKEYAKLATSTEEPEVIKNLKLKKVIYEVDSLGRRVAIAPAEGNDLEKTLDYLATLPDVEEVTADKEKVTITFFAAGLGD